MTQQTKNRDLALDLYRSIDAQDIERLQALVSPRCQSCMGGKQLVEHYGDFDSAGLMQQLMQSSAA